MWDGEMGWNMALVVKKNETLIREGDTCSINIFPYFTILVPIKKPCIRKTVTWATFQHTVARSTTEKKLTSQNLYCPEDSNISCKYKLDVKRVWHSESKWRSQWHFMVLIPQTSFLWNLNLMISYAMVFPFTLKVKCWRGYYLRKTYPPGNYMFKVNVNHNSNTLGVSLWNRQILLLKLWQR